MPPQGSATTRLPRVWIRLATLSASGANVSLKIVSWDWRNYRVAGDLPAFPPSVVVAIKALACELPHEHDLPLSRLSLAEIRHEAITRGIVACIGTATLWRWLSQDAIRPWTHRSWIFPRDPAFQDKAGRVLRSSTKRPGASIPSRTNESVSGSAVWSPMIPLAAETNSHRFT